MTKYFTCFIILCTYSVILNAQSCTSGLGDPIVNITFGAGPGDGPALPTGITNLTYVTNECPIDGNYSIVNTTHGCYYGGWHTVNEDHTGDPNGYFMLINASYQPNEFYVQTVNGLCESTTYQFAAWVLNIDSTSKEIKPNITFTIAKLDGTILQTYNTGDIPATAQATWTQYGFYFATPPGISSVVLKMTNNAPGGVGNDLALDDITFRPAGAMTLINVKGFPGSLVTTCASQTDSLQFLSMVQNCYATILYQWQQSSDNGQTWKDITGAVNSGYSLLPATAGTFSYRLTVAQPGLIGMPSCRIASTQINLSVTANSFATVSIETQAATCTDTIPLFTAITANVGLNPEYSWQINGVNTGSNTVSFTNNSLQNGDMVACRVTSDATCPAIPTVESTQVPVAKISIKTSALSILASAITICSDSEVVFTANPTNPGDNPSFQWLINNNYAGTNGAVFSCRNLEDSDVVNCVMISSLQCAVPVNSLNVVTMTVYPLPAISLPSDTVIAAGSSLSLNSYHSSFDSVSNFQWFPSIGLDNSISQDPIATPTENTTYQLYAVGNDGCSTVLKETVTVYHNLNMPTGFTPNGDGKNDIFIIPQTEQVQIIRFSIYNQWGNLVFSTENGTSGWDGTFSGKPQSIGTYVWMISYMDLLTDKPMNQSGTVMLMR